MAALKHSVPDINQTEVTEVETGLILAWVQGQLMK